MSDDKSKQVKKFFKHNKLKIAAKISIGFAVVFFVLAILLVGSVFAYQKIFSDTIYPGITYIGLDLSGKTFEQANEEAQKKVNEFLQKPLIYKFEDKKVEIYPLEQDLIDIKVEQSILDAYKVGREDEFINNLQSQFNLLLFGNKIPIVYCFDQQKLEDLLKTDFSEFEQPAIDASIKINDDLSIEIIPSKDGNVFVYQDYINTTEERLINFETVKVDLTITPVVAEIKQEYLVNKNEEISQVLNLENIIFNFKDEQWQYNAKKYKDWLAYKKIDDKITLVFSEELMFSDLSLIADEIKTEPVDAKFTMENNKVQEFQASQNGLDLNIESSVARINSEVIEENNKEVELVVDEILAEITTNSINDLGIKELIGVGESNFSGSPSNRRHNISVGTNSLSGILVKPGEEFSILDGLGEINGATGYLPELVIKGNKTVPEYGGGLCQVATTMFRAAVNSGLPITERKHHKYRVSYYEPAGFDATIYDPSPDLKFLNDTDHHILIQGKIVGSLLYFEFYGTNDGRKTEVTKPVIYNITYPGPAKYIETTELAPGQKKWVEGSHNGADAYFTRKVTYKDGEVKEDRWDSHYVAWQAVCMVGKEEVPAVDENSEVSVSE